MISILISIDFDSLFIVLFHTYCWISKISMLQPKRERERSVYEYSANDEIKFLFELSFEFYLYFKSIYVQCASTRIHDARYDACTCSRIIKNSRLHHPITFSINVWMAAFGTLTFMWIFAYRTLLVCLSNFSSWCSSRIPYRSNWGLCKNYLNTF